jgi:hypothetical protein
MKFYSPPVHLLTTYVQQLLVGADDEGLNLYKLVELGSHHCSVVALIRVPVQ